MRPFKRPIKAADIDVAAAELKLALVVLRSQAQKLRSSLSTLRIRHDFTKVNGRCIADRLWIISRLRIAATKVPTCLLYKADSIVDHRTFYGDQSGEKCVPIVLAIQTSPRRQVLFRRFRDEEWHRMALKVELKAGERFILGNCLITNSAQRIQLLIEGDAPILREKDIMTAEQANSPAKRIYFAIQLIYTARDPIPYHELYFDLMRDLLQAAPSTWPHILTINNHILAGEMYKALKSAQNLIAYEEALVAAVGASRSIAATEFDRTDGNPVCPRDYRGDISGKRAPERDQLAVGPAASTHAQARRRASHLR